MGVRLRRREHSAAVRSNGRSRARSVDREVVGTVRVDNRTKRLVPRLLPGNIAIIDHDDLDRVAAESLLEHGVSAVVNARASISGRYPNLGPLILVHAGIPILDEVGTAVLSLVEEGVTARLEGNELYVDDRLVATGTLLTEERVRERMDAARAVLSQTVEAFAENTLDYIKREQDILLESLHLPEIKTNFRGRHVLVVTRGHHYKQDLKMLKAYVREMRPVVVAVDGAADACLAEGIVPDCIVGDMDSASTRALLCGAELFVHPQGDWRRRHQSGDDPGEPPESATLRGLGLEAHIITAQGTSEDVAMLLAWERGAELVVTVGSHTSAVEFLDKGRKGMASTFLTRLRIGASLVDAKGVSQLYRPSRVRLGELLTVILAASITMLITVFVISRPARLYGISLWELLTQVVFRIRSWF